MVVNTENIMKRPVCHFIFKILIIAVLDAMFFTADLITYAATPSD